MSQNTRPTLPAHIRYFEAPNYHQRTTDDGPGVFLAGGITNCPRWHDRAVELLATSTRPLTIYNPNRANFPIGDPTAGHDQVQWEQAHLHQPHTLRMFWFPASDPALTTQPIAMYELGQAADTGWPMVIGVDDHYPRAADVRLLLGYARPELTVYASLDAVLAAALGMVGSWYRQGRRFR